MSPSAGLLIRRVNRRHGRVDSVPDYSIPGPRYSIRPAADGRTE